MIGLVTYMTHFYSCKLELDKVFHDVQEVDDVHNNDNDALLSRACHVQAHEEVSWFTGLSLQFKFFLVLFFFSNMCTFVCQINKLIILLVINPYPEVVLLLGQHSVRMANHQASGCHTPLKAFFHASSHCGSENLCCKCDLGWSWL